MTESSQGVAFKGQGRSGQQSGAGVFLSPRREGVKETQDVLSLTDGWWMCLLIYKMGSVVLTCTLNSRFFSSFHREDGSVTRGGAREVLGWGGCPPLSSPGGCLPSSRWCGAPCSDSAFRTQVLVGEVMPIAAESPRCILSPPWLGMHHQAYIRYRLRAIVGQSLDCSPLAHAISEIRTASLQL